MKKASFILAIGGLMMTSAAHAYTGGAQCEKMRQAVQDELNIAQTQEQAARAAWFNGLSSTRKMMRMKGGKGVGPSIRGECTNTYTYPSYPGSPGGGGSFTTKFKIVATKYYSTVEAYEPQRYEFDRNTNSWKTIPEKSLGTYTALSSAYVFLQQ